MFQRLIVLLAVVAMVVRPEALAQDETTPTPEDQARTLTVLESTEVYSASDELLWTAEPGEVYTVVDEEDGMALIVIDEDSGELAWMSIDARVEIEEEMAAEVVADIPPTAAPPTVTPIATQAPGTVPPVTQTPGPPVTQAPGTPGLRNPAAWSLTTADLPGFVAETPRVPAEPGFPGHAALFVNTRASVDQRAPVVVLNVLFPADPFIPNVTQAMMDELALGTVQALAEGGAATRTGGPPVGDVTSWGHATATQNVGGVTMRFVVHLVAFAVGRDVGMVAAIHPEGSGDQAETARLANIVAGRMRG